MDEKGLLRQRREALAKANESRFYRAKLKRQLKSRQMTLEEVQRLIFDPPPQIRTMKVGILLEALPTFGRTKRDKALKKIKASPGITLQSLSSGQRRQLALLVSNYRRYLLSSPDQPDQEVTNGDYTPSGNHDRSQRSAA